jgi:cysteine desulfurase / selenocysteine lyase
VSLSVSTPALSPPDGVAGEFPVLAREFGGRPLCYLDSGATSQKPQAVIDAITAHYTDHNANIHRGVYPLAVEATEAYEGARRRVAAWLRSSYEETIFAKNATEAINLVAYSWGRAHVGEGDTIVLTQMEHHSNIVPWQRLAQERGASVEYVQVDDAGRLDLGSLDRLLQRSPKLVGVVHVSNVLGTLNPVEDVVRRAHEAGARVLIDGSQAVPQFPVDVGAIDADFYVWTAHKAYGPTGIGVLHGRRELLEEMPPFLSGGDMISSVGWESSRWNDLPWKFEAGTSPIAEGAGLGAAVLWLERLGMGAVRAHESDLVAHALERLAEVPGLTVHGPSSVAERGALVSFSLEGVHPHDVAEILARDAVCIRAGHHCAQPLMRRLGVGATSRASFAVHNTRADVDRLVDGLAEVRRIFGLA